MVNTKNKTHLIFPSELLEVIDKLIGKRKRSKFITEVVRKELKRIQLLRVLEGATGAWQDKDHPEIKKKGTWRWIRDLRKEEEERFK